MSGSGNRRSSVLKYAIEKLFAICARYTKLIANPWEINPGVLGRFGDHLKSHIKRGSSDINCRSIDDKNSGKDRSLLDEFRMFDNLAAKRNVTTVVDITSAQAWCGTEAISFAVRNSH